MEISLYDLYRDLKAKRILFCYSGPIAQASIEGVGGTLRRHLEIEDASNTTTLAVFSVFVELVQNIQNYSAETVRKTDGAEDELRVGVVVIGHDKNDDYFIYCGNRVENHDIPKMRESIELVRNLSREELKALYKERRKKEPEPGSKGAGLGLIEMARRAGKPLEYAFLPVDADFSFFSIKVAVRR